MCYTEFTEVCCIDAVISVNWTDKLGGIKQDVR